MSPKIYVVDVTTTFSMCVLAEDQDQARRIARENAQYEYGNQDADWEISVGGAARTLTEVPGEWHEALPYVADGQAEPDYVEKYFGAEAGE